MSFFQQAAGRMFLSSSVESLMEILLPLSFAPCIILGKLIDAFSVMPVLLLVNTFGLLCYCFVISPSIPMQYAATVFFMLYVSVFTSQVYCFIEETFASRHFGKLIGLTSCIGGLLSLVSNILYEWLTVIHLNGNFLPVCTAFIIALTLSLLLLYFMWRDKRKKHKILIQQRARILNLPTANS
eukprot:GHVT01046560.1.p1 GENE.GHVT01046560.1~~GHVT01046560.1.p1  ORF type:complete len:183 (-),score=17.79 GHVT01046560.1:476-1024(-)